MESKEIIKKYELERLLNTRDKEIRLLMLSIEDTTREIEHLDANINNYINEIVEFIQTKASKIEIMETCKVATISKRNKLEEQLCDVKRTK